MGLTVVGTIITVAGVFLPWLSGTVTSDMLSTSNTVTGYDLNQGLIGAGIAILSAVLSFLGSGNIMPRKTVGFLIVIASVVLIVVSGSLILDPGGGTTRLGPTEVRTYISLQPSIFITAIGGLILLIGGLITSFRSE